ncbi:MAG TPA: hypothetical protein VIX37_17040 [Candidatus Sulfotelmatobacter sp.]
MSSNGAQIPLGQVADLGAAMGPSMISSENGLLRESVLMKVRGATLAGSWTSAVAREVGMQPGYYIEREG